MDEKRKCLVGNDDDNGGWLITLLIAVAVVACILAIIFYGGAFIGGYHSLKNYVLAFKHNVIDSNFAPASAA